MVRMRGGTQRVIPLTSLDVGFAGLGGSKAKGLGRRGQTFTDPLVHLERHVPRLYRGELCPWPQILLVTSGTPYAPAEMPRERRRG